MPRSLWTEIERWVINGIEGTKVELKREFPLTDRPSRARFAKLITAMANASGGTGYFIVGVVDKKERKEDSLLDDIIWGVSHNSDSYQKLIQQALTDFTNPVPNVSYQEIEPPGTNKRIGIIIIERSLNKPHEINRDGEGIGRGFYLKRGAEVFPAGREDILTMMGKGRQQGIIVNFTHPITDSQIKQIEERMNLDISEIVQPSKVPVHFNENDSFEEQVVKSIDEVGLTDEQWQGLRILVNVPGFATIAASLIAELHGRMGHFPQVLRFKRSPEDTSRYDFAEVVQLQSIRDNARARHQE